VDTSDGELAESLAAREAQAQLARDEELANQLQQQEMAYRPPR